MISGKNVLSVFLLTFLLFNSNSAHGSCPFLDSVAPTSVKDSARDGLAFVSLAWVARDFSVAVRSIDTTDSCIFDLDKYSAGSKTVGTRLFSFAPGRYRLSYQRRHEPGSHSSTAWSDTVIELKPGVWYITRFTETSIKNREKSVMKLIRAKAWQLELTSTAKEKVIKHSSGEQPGVKTIVLVGIVLVTLLFGGLMVYAR